MSISYVRTLGGSISLKSQKRSAAEEKLDDSEDIYRA
jgi:hypothetical protein